MKASLSYGSIVGIISLLCCAACNKAPTAPPTQEVTSAETPITIPESSVACIECHTGENIGVAAIIGEWKHSTHAKEGVGCFDCHEAQLGDADAFEHHGKLISIIVSPKDCGTCHETESQQFQQSHHAKGGEILGSLDNVLGEIIEGPQAAINGCKQCHGSQVEVLEGGKLSANTWPNTGIGRINPDGSTGSCTACHSRHLFSAAVARRPENCGKCHMGPDHPQKEIFDESKHGIAFYANEDKMNLDSEKWVVGEDYTAAPTCATCHMSATKDMPVNHDAGARISWTLRPAVSNKLENWEERRDRMNKVCANCHSGDFVESFYVQFDGAVELYNEKFGKPAVAIMKSLKDAGKITPDPFDDEIEWTFFYLWHHEGRRARHGASMMGPDYTQWHGFFEVADNFYNHFVPQAEKLLPGVTKEVMDHDLHKWKKGLPKEERDRIKKFYEDRYGKKE